MKPSEPAKPVSKEKLPEKPKSQAAERAVLKPKPKPEPPEESWKGGVDHFSERV